MKVMPGPIYEIHLPKEVDFCKNREEFLCKIEILVKARSQFDFVFSKSDRGLLPKVREKFTSQGILITPVEDPDPKFDEYIKEMAKQGFVGSSLGSIAGNILHHAAQDLALDCFIPGVGTTTLATSAVLGVFGAIRGHQTIKWRAQVRLNPLPPEDKRIHIGVLAYSPY